MASKSLESGVSDAQRAALEHGALVIATNTTVPHEILHHYLTGEDLATLEHASKVQAGPWFFLLLGAALGGALPALIAFGELSEAGWDPKNLASLNAIWPLVVEGVFVGGAIALGIVTFNARGRSVTSICTEIRARTKQNGK